MVSTNWRASSKVENNRTGFLDLPFELRLEIYELILGDKDVKIVFEQAEIEDPSDPAKRERDFDGAKLWPRVDGELTPLGRHVHPQLLRVCHQLHSEGSRVLYGHPFRLYVDLCNRNDAFPDFRGKPSTPRLQFPAHYAQLVRRVEFSHRPRRPRDTDHYWGHLGAVEHWRAVLQQATYYRQQFPNARQIEATVKLRSPKMLSHWGLMRMTHELTPVGAFHRDPDAPRFHRWQAEVALTWLYEIYKLDHVPVPKNLRVVVRPTKIMAGAVRRMEEGIGAPMQQPRLLGGVDYAFFGEMVELFKQSKRGRFGVPVREEGPFPSGLFGEPTVDLVLQKDGILCLLGECVLREIVLRRDKRTWVEGSSVSCHLGVRGKMVWTPDMIDHILKLERQQDDTH